MNGENYASHGKIHREIARLEQLRFFFPSCSLVLRRAHIHAYFYIWPFRNSLERQGPFSVRFEDATSCILSERSTHFSRVFFNTNGTADFI